jgi:hypothetical protein
MRQRLIGRSALVAAAVPAIAVLWLSLHPAPATQSKPLFAGAEIDVPAVKLFQRACQNCHSENTDWPWYSRLPPTSCLIHKDVDDARQNVNFSNWEHYSPAQQQELLSKIGSMVRTGRMPLPRYIWLHSEAALTDEERHRIYEWSRDERKRLQRGISRNTRRAGG